MSEGSLAFNPDFDPDGAEGGVDTNLLPWLPKAFFRRPYMGLTHGVRN